MQLPSETRLRAVLHRGDPAQLEPPLSADELQRIRSTLHRPTDRVTAAGSGRLRRPPFWIPALASAALLVLAVWLTLPAPGPPHRQQAPQGSSIETPSPGPITGSPSVSGRTPTTSSGPSDTTELYFTAPNGTRIVWSLRHEHGSGDAEVRS